MSAPKNIRTQADDHYDAWRPDLPITLTTKTEVGFPNSVEDGLSQIARHVEANEMRDGKFTFYNDGVLVTVTLADKSITRSWSS